MMIKCFFYCHRQFLPTDHKYRKNINDFFVGRVERDVTSPLPLGEKLYDMVSKYNDIMFGFQFGKQKFLCFGLTNNWVKQSIFWELSYWKTNLLCHTFDIMYIEKNVFENNYCKCHCNCLLTDEIIDDLFDGYLLNSPMEILTNKKITDGMIYNFSVGDMLYSAMKIPMEWSK